MKKINILLTSFTFNQDETTYRVGFLDDDGNKYGLPESTEIYARIIDDQVQIQIIVNKNDPNLILIGVTSAFIPKLI